MTHLGKLSFDGIPRVAVPLTDATSQASLANARRLGVDIVEIRVDLFASFDIPYILAQAARFNSFPTIATVRSKKEGGSWSRSEEERLEIFKALIPETDAIDIELSSPAILKKLVADARKAEKKVILSHHDFRATPSSLELDRIFKEAKAAGADIVKIAAAVSGAEDIQRLAAFTIEHARDQIITIGMGSEGSVSRLLFPGLGSLITFASLDRETASGQLDFETTSSLLRKIYPSYALAKQNPN